MIWNPHICPDPKESAVASYVKGEIKTLSEAIAGDGLDAVEDLALTVAHFIEHDSGKDVVDSAYLVLLASRALDSIGQKRAACCLFMLGTGLLTPVEWQFTGGKTVWTLDLKRMTVSMEARVELIFFNGLNIVLECIADIWDQSQGQGVLALRHVSAAAAGLLGMPYGKQNMKSLAKEIKFVVHKKFAQIARERAWKHAPDVIDLDV